MYTQEQYERALSLYDECGSVTKTMTQLGYPARRQTRYNPRDRNFTTSMFFRRERFSPRKNNC